MLTEHQHEQIQGILAPGERFIRRDYRPSVIGCMEVFNLETTMGAGINRNIPFQGGRDFIVVDGESFYEHRYLMTVYLGRDLYPGENVHHKNGNRIDNSPENLEVWISQQPPGQRVTDLVAHAISILKQYPNELADEGYRLLALESAEATKAILGEPSFRDFDAGAYLSGLMSAGG
jgi:hypothetical protein